MDAITWDDLSLQARREISLLAALKRPRTDLTLTEQNSSTAFSQLLAFQKTFASSSLTSRNNTVLTSASGFEENGKHYKQQEDFKLNTSLLQQNVTVQTDAERGSLEVYVFTAGIDHTQATFGDTHKTNLKTADFAASATSHKSEISMSDMSSLPDCEQPGKSLDDNPPGGCRAFSRHGNDETQVQNDINKEETVTLRSVDKEVGYTSGCICKDETCEVCCILYQQACTVEETSELEHKYSNSDNTGCKAEEEVTSHIATSDNGDYNLTSSHRKEESCAAETGERETIELQICENVPVCDGGTENQVNEYDTNGKMISAALKCTKGTVECDDVKFDRNVATESASINDLCERRGNRAAGKMTAKPGSEKADHTTVIPITARISQEAAEGDNEAGPFVVFDPAIWRETDREGGKRRHSLECTEGVELSPSLKAGEITLPLPPSPDIGVNLCQTERFFDQSRKDSKAENKDLCQLASETQSYPLTANEIHDVNGDEDGCHWTSSPSSCRQNPTAGDDTHTCLATVGNPFKEQNHSCPSFVTSEHLETQEVGCSQPGNTVTDVTNETSEREELAIFAEEFKSEDDGLAEVIYLDQSEEQNEMVEISTVDFFDDWMVGISGKCGETSPDECGASWCLYDHSYSANKIANDSPTRKAEKKNCEQIKTAQPEYMTNEDDLLELASNECNAQPSDKVRGEDNQENKIKGFYLTSEAVVPGQNYLSPECQSQSEVSNSSALYAVAPAPSVLTHSNQLQREFDTFEKIHLSLDDDDDDDDNDQDLGSSHLLTSLQGQLLKTLQWQLDQTMPGAERDEHMFIPPNEAEKKDKVENSENDIKKTNESVSSDLNGNEPPPYVENLDQQLACQDELNTENKSTAFFCKSAHSEQESEFEMKQQFEMVLKELNVYFEISRNDLESGNGDTSHEQCHDMTDVLDVGPSNHKKHSSSPEELDHEDALPEADCAQEMCEGVSAVFTVAGNHSDEQEVPHGSFLCQEESVNTREKQRELQDAELKRKWSPSFDCSPVMEPNFRVTSDQSRRLGPLKTCLRPIRIGLSKREKTKRLHPYN